MIVIKKDGSVEPYNEQKIINAVGKSAKRTLQNLTGEDYSNICNKVYHDLLENDYDTFENDEVLVPVEDIHAVVEQTLLELYPTVGKQYQQYRNYKLDFCAMLDDVYTKSQGIRYIGDVSNANTDSTMISTQRSLIYGQLNKNLYQKFFLTKEENIACNEGYIYVHDAKDRLDGINCFRRDTKFITKDGVKSFYDFSDGDETIVLTHKGNWKKAVVHSYGWQPIQKVTFKKSVPTSKPREIYCTANHRWILKDNSETTSLKIGDTLYQIQDLTKFNWDDLSLENKKLWCKGFAKGDGSLIGGADKNRPTYVVIRLCGDKIKYESRFNDCGYNSSKIKDTNDVMVYMLDTNNKDIPFLSLNYSNVLYYINGLMCADGHKTLNNSNSEFRGIQATGELNKYLYDLLNMSGYFVTSTRDLTGQKTNYGERNGETIHYQLSTSQLNNSAWKVIDISEEKLNPKAVVWCLEVEDDHSFILEGGIPTGNCCLADITNILTGGFEMGNIWYNEPKTLDTAFDVIGDIVFAMSAQQYGGYTLPRIDNILIPYAEKSYQMYLNEYVSIRGGEIDNDAKEYAERKVRRDFEQGFQGWEYKFNTVGSSRGDYPFIAVSFGLETNKWGSMASEVILEVRQNGQGKKGFKKPVLFPKLTFLYDKNLHGDGSDKYPLGWLFDKAIICSSKTMYPDYLSLTGEGYIASIYKKYGKVISLMGCRASLSPWFERGGMKPADENDVPIFEGRFNMGAISLNLPMILQKSRQENKDFYEVLNYYLEMIRGIHKRTYEFLGEKKASTNPIGFMQGGFLGGHLQANDKIKPLLKAMTMSFGITALNEMQYLYNKKTLVEDNEFALEVMKYINDYANRIKEEDGILYAIYGTPAESLAGLQVEQFRKKYGIIEGVSDKPYVSNSFHCHVSEQISPIVKQDREGMFWDYFNGGKIQYCRYNLGYNIEAIKSLVLRAMEKGFYEGVNLALCYCEDCGYQQIEMDVCPKCGSTSMTKIDRMNGYLGYSRIKGSTRYNPSKMAEIKDRVSM